MSARQIFTRTDFRTRVRDSLGPSNFWSDDELNVYINFALRDWNRFTGYWKRRITLTTQQYNPYLSLPTTLTMGMRVEFNGSPLAPGSVFDWDKMYPYWEGESSTPVEWAPVGLNLIAIRPADSRGNNSLVVDGVSATPVLAADADFVDLGQEQFGAVLDYIQHLASFKEGGREFQNTEGQLRHFIAEAGLNCERFRASSLYRRLMGLDTDFGKKKRRQSVSQGESPVGVR